MLAWVMNLGFAASDASAPVVTTYKSNAFLLLGTGILAFLMGVI